LHSWSTTLACNFFEIFQPKEANIKILIVKNSQCYIFIAFIPTSCCALIKTFHMQPLQQKRVERFEISPLVPLQSPPSCREMAGTIQPLNFLLACDFWHGCSRGAGPKAKPVL